MTLKFLALPLIWIALYSTTACVEKSNTGQNPIITNVSVGQAKKLIAENRELIILDVRTPQEVAQGIIKGAINIDISRNDFKTKVAKLDKNKPILVYCKAGARSEDASDIMKDLGFKKLYNLEDGYDAWK